MPVQNQAMTDSKVVAQAVLNVGSGATVVTTGVLPAGVYRLDITTVNLGTAETTALGFYNMALRHGSTVIGALNASNSPVRTVVERVTLSGAESANVVATAASASGAIYFAEISATRVGA